MVLGALTVLVVVLVVKPHAPYVTVQAAGLQRLRYVSQFFIFSLFLFVCVCDCDLTYTNDCRHNQVGRSLDVQVALHVEARNGNAHSEANFTRLQCRVKFVGATLAVLRADGPLLVPPRGTVPLPFVASVQGAPLGDDGSATMEAVLRGSVVGFGVEVEAQTRWGVAGLVYINKRTSFTCEIRFHVFHGTALPFDCSSKSKFPFF